MSRKTRLGTRSGPAFADAVVDPSALVAVAAGAAVTASALLILLAGMQTQPAVLAYASDQLDNERELTLGYASVYPVTIIARIVIAQIVAALTL